MAEIAAEDLRHVTAILVVHDGALWLPQVVASLTSQNRSINQILAVDTGSADSSVPPQRPGAPRRAAAPARARPRARGRPP